VVSREEARAIALALGDVTEQDHHGRPSFRVDGKIFATLWDEDHMNVMLDEDGIHTAVQNETDVCEEFWWGKRLRAVSVSLPDIGADLLGDLLADAWEHKARRRAI
jgi:hypothetical protein